MFETRPTRQNIGELDFRSKPARAFTLTNSRHTCLLKSKLHFRWNLHDYVVSELANNGAVRSGGMN